MSLTLGSREVAATINLTVGRDVDVRFLVNREKPGTITLVIGDSIAEINFDPATVATLHDRSGAAVHKLRGGDGPST